MYTARTERVLAGGARLQRRVHVPHSAARPPPRLAQKDTVPAECLVQGLCLLLIEPRWNLLFNIFVFLFV